jgi:hypothetical protein
MTTFPALIPSTRSYSPGEFPHTAHPLLSGSEIRVRHSNTVLGVRLRLTFTAITSADLVAVRNHYRDRQGGFLPFAIPAELLSGVTTPADFTPTGHQWRYAARPSVSDVPIPGPTPTNRHDLVLELESVPPENTIVSGARITVRATVRGGSAQLGAFIESFASVVGGAASAEASTSALGAAITASALVAGGTATGGPIVDPLTAQASVVGGAASAGAIDPDFASVSLLLHMDGTNGSTTFIDSGPSGLTMTSVGGAQISTALSKFGGASGLFDGVDGRVDLPLLITYSGPYTLESWVYNSTGFGYDGIASGRGVTNGVALRTDPDGRLEFLNPALNSYYSTVALSLSTLHHVALTRNSSNVITFWIDGIDCGTVSNQSGDHVWRTVGYAGFGSEYWPGHIDDMRWTAVCRYTSNFTPPTEQFPDS